jgi:2-aminoadipate transaminase
MRALDIDALKTQFDDLATKGIVPKFIYTIPTVQNPESLNLSVKPRKPLLSITRDRREEWGATDEDESYAVLLWDEECPDSMLAMDGSDHVIPVGSFFKYLAPALRLGYVVAPWWVLGQVIACKVGGTGALEQMVVADYSNTITTNT